MNSILRRRRALMGKKSASSILPAEYQQVEWIGGNGDAYADIDQINVGLSNTVTTVAMKTANDTAVNRNVTGGGTTNYYVGLCNFFSDGTIGGSYGTNRAKCDFGDVLNKVVTVTLKLNASTIAVTATVENVVKTASANKASENTVNPVRIGYLGLSSQAVKGRIYRFYCTTSANVKRWDFYPCYRKADGVVGMYDIINNIFVSSKSGTPFSKGGNV